MMAIREERWRGAEILETNGYKFVYSGGQRHENGVGFILDRERAKGMLGYWAISDRVLLLKMKGSPLNISIVQVYAPTSDSSDEVVEAFYERPRKSIQAV